MPIGDWLRSIGLSQYEAKFREHEIDADVLAALTEDDLRRLGVALGSRKRLMQAIANLGPASKAAPSVPPTAVERRPITILYCELDGSALPSRYDIEDWRDIRGPYFDAVVAGAARFGGHTLELLDDRLMAAFGYPRAQENDAERAVRAALEIQRAIEDLNRRRASPGAPKLFGRIGIECGKVVVDLYGSVFGTAPIIAARVQAEAPSGAVLITANVQRQVAGLFIVKDRGLSNLKGAPDPVHLYRVMRVGSGRQAASAQKLTPLAGRIQDLELLLDRWDRARSGAGQLVLILGEPGIGKSRLLKEFQARIAETAHTWIDWTASQLLQNTPLHPLAAWGRLRYDPAKPPAERLAEFESVLLQLGLDPQTTAPLLAPLLEIPVSSKQHTTLAPEDLRRRQLAAIESWALAGSHLQPAILAFEDLQWSDPTSLDVLVALAKSGSRSPLFILATARPDFAPPWTHEPHHTLVTLKSLDLEEVRLMVDSIAPAPALSPNIAKVVSERTGGVPLFVEEVTRLILQSGETSAVQVVPPTLQQSLSARLDQLGEARDVAEMAAVLGREFPHALLEDLAGLPEPSLQACLDRLVSADILHVSRSASETLYRFKHALIKDAAYDNLLSSQRQTLHLRAAELLRERGELGSAQEPEAIARHYTEAGRPDLAIAWWSEAADRALRRSALREAISHLEKAIALADGLAQAALEAAVSPELRSKLRSDYARATMWSKRLAADETKSALVRVRGIERESVSERFDPPNGRWLRSYIRGDFRDARDTAEAFLREAETEDGLVETEAARRIVGLTCLFQDEFAAAQRHLERALRDYGPEGDAESRFRFNVETGATARAYLALACWRLGDAKRASALVERAVRRALAVGHVPTVVNMHALSALYDIRRDGPAAALLAGDVPIRLAHEHGMPLYGAYGEANACWARHQLAGGSADRLRQALAVYVGQSNRAIASCFLGLLRKVEAESLAALDEGLRLAGETGERWSDPDLHRTRDDALRAGNSRRLLEAEAAFQARLEAARRRQSRGFRLRAALALAKLYRERVRPGEAVAVLQLALEGLPPTVAMAEIGEADALLETFPEPVSR